MYKIFINEESEYKLEGIEIPEFKSEEELEKFFLDNKLSLCKMVTIGEKVYVEIPEGMIIFENKKLIYKSYSIDNIDKYIKGRKERLFNVLKKYYDIGVKIDVK